jgi:hypothetical protein
MVVKDVPLYRIPPPPSKGVHFTESAFIFTNDAAFRHAGEILTMG